jgi:hypothetical protein
VTEIAGKKTLAKKIILHLFSGIISIAGLRGKK